MAFAPIDSVDLLDDKAGFHLTLFLLLSAVYVFCLAFEYISTRALGNRPLSLRLFDTASAATFLFVISIFTSMVFLARDTQNFAFSRAIYGIGLIVFARLFVAREHADLPLVIAWATRIYIVCDTIAVLYQSLAILNNWTIPGFLYGLEIVGVSGVSRFGGLVLDPNRSSIILILLMGLAYFSGSLIEESKRVARLYYVIGTLLSLLTLSRTGVVALLILASVPFVRSRHKLRILAKAFLIVALLGGAVLAYLMKTQSLSSTIDLARLALFSSNQREESTAIHFQLIEEGTELFAENPKTILLGYGWGTEYEYTGQYFGDSKYSNFHCEYVSIAVQSGILGLSCLCFLLLRPLMVSLAWGPLVLIILWSCTFYQYHGEPIWWIVIIIMNTMRLRSIGHMQSAPSHAFAFPSHPSVY
jgi:hypothetical protein